jgi:hypothetical protein
VSSVPLQEGFEVYAKRFRPRQKVRLIAEVLSAYARVRWLLWRKDLPDILAALRKANGRAAPDGDAAEKLAGWRLGRVVARVLDVLPSDSRCLMRSLVLLDLLEKRGIKSTLVIGVASEPKFAAHAWVEVKGAPVLPPNEPKFSRLVEL